MTKATRISAPISTPVETSAAAVPSASAETHQLVSVALFSAIGLLVSLLVLIADQHLPGEWF